MVVEDDQRIRHALGLALVNEVVFVEAGVEEDALGRSTTVDVVLLGLMLPGGDGLAVCRALRSRGGLPITIITARSDTTDVISGLEVEPDDYVTKATVARNLSPVSEPYGAVARPGSQRYSFLKETV